MRRSQIRDPFSESKLLRLLPRFERDICPFCEEPREILTMNSASICGDCVASFMALLEDASLGEATKKQCLFCSSRKHSVQMRIYLMNKVARFRKGERLVHGHAQVSICEKCVDYCHDRFMRRQSARQSFSAELGPECGPETCLELGCDRLRIGLAIRCLQHQFEEYCWSPIEKTKALRITST
jgi:hypothetical protein